MERSERSECGFLSLSLCRFFPLTPLRAAVFRSWLKSCSRRWQPVTTQRIDANVCTHIPGAPALSVPPLHVACCHAHFKRRSKQTQKHKRAVVTCAGMVNWSQLCSRQLERSLPELHQANYGGCLFAVSSVCDICSCADACELL